jgi:hypothetical protein
LRNFLSNPLYIPPKNWAAKLENIILNNNALHGYFWKSMQINGFMMTSKVVVKHRKPFIPCGRRQHIFNK